MYVFDKGWKLRRALPCITAAHANIPNVPRLDNVVERLHLDQLRQCL